MIVAELRKTWYSLPFVEPDNLLDLGSVPESGAKSPFLCLFLLISVLVQGLWHAP